VYISKFLDVFDKGVAMFSPPARLERIKTATPALRPRLSSPTPLFAIARDYIAIRYRYMAIVIWIADTQAGLNSCWICGAFSVSFSPCQQSCCVRLVRPSLRVIDSIRAMIADPRVRSVSATVWQQTLQRLRQDVGTTRGRLVTGESSTKIFVAREHIYGFAMNRRAPVLATAVLIAALLTGVGTDVAAYGSGSSAINPRACPAASEVAADLHINIVSSSDYFTPKPKDGLWSVNLCEYLTNLDNRADTGPVAIYATHVAIQFSFPVPKGVMQGKEETLSLPVQSFAYLGDIAFGQAKYHVLYAGEGTVDMSLHTPDSPLSLMAKFAKTFI
jgi:hypothetical protein